MWYFHLYILKIKKKLQSHHEGFLLLKCVRSLFIVTIVVFLHYLLWPLLFSFTIYCYHYIRSLFIVTIVFLRYILLPFNQFIVLFAPFCSAGAARFQRLPPNHPDYGAEVRQFPRRCPGLRTDGSRGPHPGAGWLHSAQHSAEEAHGCLQTEGHSDARQNNGQLRGFRCHGDERHRVEDPRVWALHVFLLHLSTIFQLSGVIKKCF